MPRWLPFVAMAATALTFSSVAIAAVLDTKATQAYVVELNTGTVLLSKEPDKPIPPASLAKMMTMEVVFHSIKSGKISLEDTYPVSENAWRTGGAPSGTSTMFAALKSSINVADLIKGVVVQGANDACLILAEGMAGSEAEFVKLMNERAKAIGLTQSVFVNATGLPADGQSVTARELVMLARHLQSEYPELYRDYSLAEFTWNKITQRNRNPLLRLNIEADGVLTGFTEASGYSIVGSVQKDDKRVVAALGGFASDRERAEESKKLFEAINSAFAAKTLFEAGQSIGTIAVYGGTQSSLEVAPAVPVRLLLSTESAPTLTADIVYVGPLIAPVEKGQPIGHLTIRVDGERSQDAPLFAAETVGQGSLVQRATSAIKELTIGWLR